MDPKQAAKLYLLLLLSLRGYVFLYQGEELGLPQADVPFEALQDPEAIANWPATLGRDGARTPMPWEKAAKWGGFSSGVPQNPPWLPMDARHLPLAAGVQEKDKGSVLNFTRAALRLRRDSPALRSGDLCFLDAPEDVLAFSRTHGEERLICVLNFGRKDCAMPDALTPAHDVLLSAAYDQASPRTLPGLSGFIAKSAP